MRLLWISFALVALATIASAQNGGGFFSGIKNWFNRPKRQNGQRPQQGQPQQQGFGGQPQFNAQPQLQQQQRQRPANGFQGNNRFRNQNTNFVTRPGTGQQPQSANPSFRVVNSNANSHINVPEGVKGSSGGNRFTPPSTSRVCKALPFEDPKDREFPRCPDAQPNHTWNGKRYILTFNLNNDNCVKFTGYQADNYCKAQGGRAVSLDSNAKAEHFLDVSAQFAQRYYWTGGRMNHPCRTLYWPSGKAEGWESGKRYWSHTGGSKRKLAQPDNRNHDEDGLEDEICLAVLNNFYNDNIKWHDVACHHKKPTICELDN